MITPLTKPALRLTALAAIFALGACAEGEVLSPDAGNSPVPHSSIQTVECVANAVLRSVSCSGGEETPPGLQGDVIGGQNINVRLTSSNVTYSETDSIFSFDVTMTNLLREPLGTPDGATPDPDGIQVFFSHAPTPTGGSGLISVANPDGSAFFTSAGQPFYRYEEILPQNATSAAKTWQLKMPPSVTAFSFRVLVESDVKPMLVINEVLANPGGTILDADGEWFEIYNAGSKDIDLQGYVIADSAASGRRPYHRISSSVIVPAGGYAVLGNTTDTTRNGGVRVNYAYGTALQLANSLDAIKIARVVGTDTVTIDRVQYASSTISAKNGFSRELKHPSLDNANMDGSNWVDGSLVYGPGGSGTPGAANTGVEADSTAIPGPPVTVTISPSTAVIAPGATRQFSAVARDSLSRTTTTTFTWSSLNTSLATVNGTGLVTGVAVGQTSIVATAANGVADTVVVDVQVPAGLEYLDHLEFGIPVDGNAADEVLLSKPQFALSYSPTRGGPNWVAWNLNATHFGEAKRCNCFLPDPQLPDSIYHVVTSDYLNSGYSRGHMVMSEERTASDAENRVTFLMTNILPQIQDMNGGPWLKFENYNNVLARDSAKELYVISGGTYSATPATLNNAGIVQIPETTWKIAVILERGQDLADVHSAADLRVIAVNMPNVAGIQTQPWMNYVTTVDAIEALTGYDFLSALPDDIEAAIESAAFAPRVRIAPTLSVTPSAPPRR